MAEKKQKKPKRIKISVAPPAEIMEKIEAVLQKNRFPVVRGGGSSPLESAKAALAKDSAGAFCIIEKEDGLEFWGVARPDEKASFKSRLRHLRRHPDDLFVDYKAATDLVAPVYGLAGAIVTECGAKAEWVRDASSPMRVFVTRYIDVEPEE